MKDKDIMDMIKQLDEITKSLDSLDFENEDDTAKAYEKLCEFDNLLKEAKNNKTMKTAIELCSNILGADIVKTIKEQKEAMEEEMNKKKETKKQCSDCNCENMNVDNFLSALFGLFGMGSCNQEDSKEECSECEECCCNNKKENEVEFDIEEDLDSEEYCECTYDDVYDVVKHQLENYSTMEENLDTYIKLIVNYINDNCPYLNFTTDEDYSERDDLIWTLFDFINYTMNK